jgi:hypothetical protein
MIRNHGHEAETKAAERAGFEPYSRDAALHWREVAVGGRSAGT